MGIAPSWGACPRTATPDCITWVSAMSAVSHVLRRGAVYYWRRKVPRALAGRLARSHLTLSLRTWNPAHARSLGAVLDALIEELLVMPDHDGFLTQAQLDAMLRDAVLTHLAKLDRVAAAERTAAHFNRADAERADRRAAWTW